MSNLDIVRELGRVKAEFQLRSLATIMGFPRDSDASLAEDPKGLSREAVAARAGTASPNPYPRSHHMTNTDTSLADFIAEARLHASDMPPVIQRDYLNTALDKLAALTQPAVPDVREAVATEAHNLFARLDGHFDADEIELCGQILAALTQSPTCCEAGRWQPIETAPKTGKDLCAKPFLGWCLDDTAPGGGDIRVCWWEPHMDGGRWHGDRDLPEHPTHWQPLPAPPATDDVAAPRSCCADEREPRQENTIRALEEAAIDLWEQSPEIAKINPWVRCEWSEVSERSRIYWRGLALTTAIRSNSHD